jgi:hypothetical protein
MVCITVFHAGNGEYGVMPSAEYDGDPATIIREFPGEARVALSGGGNPTQIPLPLFMNFGYTRQRAVAVVEGATVRPFVTETSTMLVIGLVLSVAGIGFFCWLLFTLAVYALPLFAALTAGLAAFHSDSGVIGALVVGILAGGATLAIGQIAFATVRTSLIRCAFALVFVVPSAIAGYHATLGLAHFGIPSAAWREAFAIVGAVLVGGTAWVRMSLFVPLDVDRRGAGGPASLPLAGATRDG